jgi:hypothetical protein
MWEPVSNNNEQSIAETAALLALQFSKEGRPSTSCCSLSRCCCSILQKFRSLGLFILIVIIAPLLFIPFLFLRCCTCIPLPKSFPAWARNVLNRVNVEHSKLTMTVKAINPSKTITTQNLPIIETKQNWMLYPFAIEAPQIIFFDKNNTIIPSKDIQSPSKNKFDRNKPTLLYVHGYEPGTTARGFRETMNTPTGVDFNNTYPVLHTGNLWIERGYNICVFYWNQFSDEPDIKVAEKKIYTNGPHRCAIKSSRSNSGNGPETISFHLYGDSDTLSIAKQLRDEYMKYFSKENGYNGKVTMVGHSMGGQLVIEASRLLLFNSVSNDSSNISNIELPCFEKLCVIDPFFSSGTKNYINDSLNSYNSVADRATETLKKIKTYHPNVVLETQITSIVGEGWLGSHCAGLQKFTTYRTHLLPDMFWMNVKDRHCIAHHIFMCEILINSGNDDDQIELKKKDKDV